MSLDDFDRALENLPQPPGTTAGGATAIGDTIAAGTTGSVLFIGPVSTLAQDNTNFFWDDTANQLGLGAGTAAAPSHTFKADPDTGMYRIGANNLGLATGGVLRLDLDGTGMLFAQTVITTGSPRGAKLTFAAHTGITASTEAIDFYVNNTRTQEWATGAIAANRGVVVGQPTWAAVGASVLTTGTGMEVSTPAAGANMTITDLRGLRVLGTTTAGPSATAATYAALSIAASTITYTNTTAQTGDGSVSGIRANQITVAQNTGSGTLTVASAANLFVAAPPVAGTGTALTENPSILSLGPEIIRYTDAATNTVTDLLTLDHRSSGTAAASYGTGILFRGQDASGSAGGDDIARLSGILLTATAGAEETGLAVQCRTAGGALATVATFRGGNAGELILPTNLRFGTTATTQMTLSNATGTNTATLSVSSSIFKFQIAQNTAATSGAHYFFKVAPGSNTGQTTLTEVNSIWFATSHTRTWANGTIPLQREALWNQPTYAMTSGTNVITMAMMHDFGAAPTSSGATVAMTGLRVARMGGAATQGATAAGTTYVGLELVPSTITYTGSTQVTSTVAASQLRLDVLTLTDASAVTIDAAATLDIVGPPVGAGSVTLTNAYGLLIRAGGMKVTGNVGLYGVAPVGQGTGGENLTNSVTAGGTTGTVADYSIVDYATDAAAIRNNLYQLARALKQDHDQLRAMGILT